MLPNKKYAPADLLRIAKTRGPLIAVPAAVGLLIALVVSSQLPNVYQAETLIQIVPQSVPDAYVRSTVTIKTEDRLDALSQQVQSRTQLERMISELNLYQKERAVRPMQDVVEQMRASMSIETVRPNRVAPVDAFYLRFKYEDPVMAARVTERLGTLYIDYNARERGALAQGTNEFLESQLNEAKARLEQADRKLQAFRERHSGQASVAAPVQHAGHSEHAVAASGARGVAGPRSRPEADARAPLQRCARRASAGDDAASAAAQQSDRAGRDVPPAAAGHRQEQPDDPGSEAQGRASRPETREEAGRRSREAGGGSAGQPERPLPRRACTPEELQRRERISSMRAEIESLDRQVAFKESEERRLGSVIGDYQSRIEAVPGVESEYLALTRDYDTIQASFRDLLTKSEAARVAENLENRQIGEQFRVLDAPRVPVPADQPAARADFRRRPRGGPGARPAHRRHCSR